MRESTVGVTQEASLNVATKRVGRLWQTCVRGKELLPHSLLLPVVVGLPDPPAGHCRDLLLSGLWGAGRVARTSRGTPWI